MYTYIFMLTLTVACPLYHIRFAVPCHLSSSALFSSTQAGAAAAQAMKEENIDRIAVMKASACICTYIYIHTYIYYIHYTYAHTYIHETLARSQCN